MPAPGGTSAPLGSPGRGFPVLPCQQMSQALGTIFGAFIGGAAVLLGGFIAEAYRRHRDRQGIASAIAGEIAGLLYMTDKRQYPQIFEDILSRLESGAEVQIPKLIGGTDHKFSTMFPIIDRHLDKLGLLPDNLPERVVRFYQFVAGIRLDMERLAANEINQDGRSFVIRSDLELWRETVILGERLVLDLRDIAARKIFGATP
jgi:hypothetical protein